MITPDSVFYLPAQLLVAFLIVVGAAINLIGSYALAKLPESMMRIHGPTKTATLGVGSLVLASLVNVLLLEEGASLHELLIMIFIFMTTPISAYMIAKTHVFRTRGRTGKPLPETGTEAGWATLHGSDSFRADDPKAKDRLGAPM